MTWLDLPAETGFGIENLPYGVFSRGDDAARRIGVAIGDDVFDIGAVATDRAEPFAALLRAPVLNPLLAAGRPVWRQIRAAVTDWLTDPAAAVDVGPHLHHRSSVSLHLPYEVADYADFYASEYHASNVGAIFGRADPLHPNWKHLPCGYHGRAGSVVVSGTPIRRPHGQFSSGGAPVFGRSQRLDFEAEVGFLLGPGTPMGSSIAVADVDEHVFGMFLLNDWSARDLQAWETVPLGPFLGKSFATSVSPWVVPLDALNAARVPPARDPADPTPLPYLRDATDPTTPPDPRHAPHAGLDLTLEVRLNGHVISRPPFASMYWTYAQQLAHLTINGAPTRPGDIYASGTVSGPGRAQRGSMLELSWGGADPIALPDGETRTFLHDGDEVIISATAPGPAGTRLDLGDVRGTVLPAP